MRDNVFLSDIQKWMQPPKGKYCIKCGLSHCSEVGADYTVGCCICFARQEKKDGKTPITPCYECEMYECFDNHTIGFDEDD